MLYVADIDLEDYERQPTEFLNVWRLVNANQTLFLKIKPIVFDGHDVIGRYKDDGRWFIRPLYLSVQEGILTCVTPWINVYGDLSSNPLNVIRCCLRMLDHGVFYGDWNDRSNFSMCGDDFLVIDIDSTIACANLNTETNSFVFCNFKYHMHNLMMYYYVLANGWFERPQEFLRSFGNDMPTWLRFFENHMLSLEAIWNKKLYGT